jgi:hypothetical protein
MKTRVVVHETHRRHGTPEELCGLKYVDHDLGVASGPHDDYSRNHLGGEP